MARNLLSGALFSLPETMECGWWVPVDGIEAKDGTFIFSVPRSQNVRALSKGRCSVE